jgi:hypothetical protein
MITLFDVPARPGIDSLASIPGLLKRLQIRALPTVPPGSVKYKMVGECYETIVQSE